MGKGNINKIIFFTSVAALVICAVIFFVLPFFISQETPLPQRFVDSSRSAGEVSKEIVSLTTKTNNAIHTVNSLDLLKDKETAISLLNEAREANKKAYDQAFLLSQNLQGIAESLAGIRSQESQRIGYDAVATELALVSEFITYTQNLQVFLDRVSVLMHTNTEEQKAAVNESLLVVNEKTRIINQLNADFLRRMKEFEDSL